MMTSVALTPLSNLVHRALLHKILTTQSTAMVMTPHPTTCRGSPPHGLVNMTTSCCRLAGLMCCRHWQVNLLLRAVS